MLIGFRLGVVMALVSTVLPLSTFAQENPRNSFPGRRVGGGTRAACSSRVLAHLVPTSSVFAPAPAGTLGLLHGPTPVPVALNISFRPQSGGQAMTRTLPAASAGITLIKLDAVETPQIWESHFACQTSGPSDHQSFGFVGTDVPPALSLLVTSPEAADQVVWQTLTMLQQRCGSSIPTSLILKEFGLTDVITSDWPKQLPVRCPA